jgi:hypothetical protein
MSIEMSKTDAEFFTNYYKIRSVYPGFRIKTKTIENQQGNVTLEFKLVPLL